MRTLIACTIATVFIAPVSAEVPLLSKKELREESTLVVTGRVEAVYSKESNEGDWQVRQSVARVAVGKIEKGASPSIQSAVYVHFWNQSWIGNKAEEPPHSQGHYGLKKGQYVRVFLHKKRGRYEMMLPNGVELIKAPAAPAVSRCRHVAAKYSVLNKSEQPKE